MSPNNSPALLNQGGKKKLNTTALKLLITSSSMAVTIGLWSLFSSKQEQNTANSADGSASQPAQVDLLGLPPLPTLVPIRTKPDIQLHQVEQSSNLIPSLREVTAPTEIPTTIKKPVIEQVIVEAPVSGSGDSQPSSSSKKPAAKTRSSR